MLTHVFVLLEDAFECRFGRGGEESVGGSARIKNRIFRISGNASAVAGEGGEEEDGEGEEESAHFFILPLVERKQSKLADNLQISCCMNACGFDTPFAIASGYSTTKFDCMRYRIELRKVAVITRLKLREGIQGTSAPRIGAGCPFDRLIDF